MNLYLKKKQTKILLFSLAVIIAGISLWYSNIIVGKISNEERSKVELWSKAIQRRAKLVDYTGKLFDLLREEERKKVNHVSQATSILASPRVFEDYSIITQIITDNTTIPIIVVDEEGRVITSNNLRTTNDNDPINIQAELRLMKKENPPLKLQYTAQDVQYLYYRDSHTLRELEVVMDDLINSFISETVVNTASVPVLFMDSTKTNLLAFGNIDSLQVLDSTLLKERIAKMEAQNDPIRVNIAGVTHFIFYEDSFLLTQLKYYPYLQLTAIGLFLLISYLLFNTFRNAEQNHVWVGMAKETAHQLGTPLSSLMAWTDMLQERKVEERILKELKNDIDRLDTVVQRFSKIGSIPKLQPYDVKQVLQKSIDYLKTRVSSKVDFHLEIIPEKANYMVEMSRSLFEWVIENLVRNAVDAMNGEGKLIIRLSSIPEGVYIDIQDTGTGISRTKFKTIFEPGYTTKKRGWGLGLSLTKRIIEKYHDGKIFVKDSGIHGTTFRITLKKHNENA